MLQRSGTDVRTAERRVSAPSPPGLLRRPRGWDSLGSFQTFLRKNNYEMHHGCRAVNKTYARGLEECEASPPVRPCVRFLNTQKGRVLSGLCSSVLYLPVRHGHVFMSSQIALCCSGSRVPACSLGTGDSASPHCYTSFLSPGFHRTHGQFSLPRSNLFHGEKWEETPLGGRLWL